MKSAFISIGRLGRIGQEDTLFFFELLLCESSRYERNTMIMDTPRSHRNVVYSYGPGTTLLSFWRKQFRCQ